MPRPKKPDPAHAKTDEMLAGLERRIAEEYAQAAKDMASKYEKYMRKFEAGIEKQRSLLDAGEITKKEYTDWVYRHTLMTDRWKEMRDVLAKDLENSRDIARKMAGEQVADVYALNHNYAIYDIEHSAKIDTGLTLYNHDTAEYLLGDPRELMPGPSTRRAAEIAQNKAMQWDKQKIQSAVLQGVLQGETPVQVAKRLQGVAEMGYNAAVRYARTMTTSAQNAGRYQAYHRAKKLGVELVIEWVAVLDNHTRHSHRMMHGQRRDVDEPFIITDDSGATFEIMYPADCSGLSDAPQSQIWNCRCTLKPMVKGFERETVKSSPGMGDMSFEEWQQANAPRQTRQADLSPMHKIKQAIDSHEGMWDLDEIQDVGRKIIKEIDDSPLRIDVDKIRGEIREQQYELYKEIDSITKQNSELNKRIKASTDKQEKRELRKQLEESRAKKRDFENKYKEMTDRYWNTKDNRSEILRDKLSEIRKMGGVNESNVEKFANFMSYFDESTDAKIKAKTIEAMSYYPTEWLEKSNGWWNNLKPHWTTERAYYATGRGEIRFSESLSTNVHELGHRFEEVVPGILQSENAFYKKRTEGENLQWLGPGYDESEESRFDNFLNPYMGKDYGGRAYELVSMGFEYAFSDFDRLSKDEDMASWIIGLLATA